MKTTWRTCPTHGDEDPNVYGCATCVRQLREELKSAKAMLTRVTTADSVDDLFSAKTECLTWLDDNPEGSYAKTE